MVFLVTVRPTHPGPVKYDRTKPFREQVFSSVDFTNITTLFLAR